MEEKYFYVVGLSSIETERKETKFIFICPYFIFSHI